MWRMDENRCDQISRSSSGLIRYPRSMGRRTAAEVRSWSPEFRWSHFFDAGGRYRQLGTMAEGSRSPPRPALIRPPPLSRTTTFVDVDIRVTQPSNHVSLVSMPIGAEVKKQSKLI